jgi:hypothetical protein
MTIVSESEVPVGEVVPMSFPTHIHGRMTTGYMSPATHSRH